MGRTRQHGIELTERQRQVLRLIGRGHTNLEIADRLGITLAGAKWHVSELLNKFGVETREDLAQRWEAESGVAARAGRLWAGLVGLLPLKPSAAAIVGVVAVAGLGVGAAYGVAVMQGSDDPAEANVAAVASPTPIPTVVATPTLPAAPGAIWTAQEALAKAEVWAAKDIKDLEYLNEFARNVDLQLTEAQWFPALSHFELPDGDHYWDATAPINSWYFVLRAEDASVQTNAGVEIQDFTFNVLLEDGAERPAATLYTARNQDGNIGRQGGGFRNRASEQRDADYTRKTTPVGATIDFWWHNDLAGGAPIGAFANADGAWCVVGRNSDQRPGTQTWCGPNIDSRPFSASASTTFNNGVMGDYVLFVDSSPDIVSLKVLPGDGRELLFVTYAPPAESGITRRFAWLNIGRISADGYTIVGYDASGGEVAREGSEAPGPPPPNPPGR